jgi:hypothetical protein
VRDNKEKGKAKRDILDRLDVIRALEGEEGDNYQALNRELEEIMDRELRNRTGKFAEFFRLNNEQPTRMFYKLGRKGKGNESVNAIRDKEGGEFSDEIARKRYFGSYYGTLYKKRIDR